MTIVVVELIPEDGDEVEPKKLTYIDQSADEVFESIKECWKARQFVRSFLEFIDNSDLPYNWMYFEDSDRLSKLCSEAKEILK